MNLCFYNLNLKNPVINASFGGMYHSFWKALELRNHKVTFTDQPDQIAGDILVVPLGGYQEKKAAEAMLRTKIPVIVYVPPAYSWFYKSFLTRWKHRIIFAYGTDASDYTTEMYQTIDIPYYHIPFASDPAIFQSLETPKIYDIVFVGNYNSGEGRFRYIEKLIEAASEHQWKVLLIGNGWQKFGHPYQLVAHGELLNLIYNSSRICLNIHNDIQHKGSRFQMDANNRLFDLAMAGCFQIGNATDLVKIYFEEDEVVTTNDPENIVKKVEYYLRNDNLRSETGKKAQKKALASHTWDNRATFFSDCIEKNTDNFKEQNPAFIQRMLQNSDLYRIPAYQLKQIRLYKKWFHQ
jgi:spore maturation protein CgeB